MPELLTICIPTYNRPEYLQSCLESILAQTFQDYRIVILDNGSEKDYSGVLRCIIDSRITYRRHNSNLGNKENIKIALREYLDTKYIMVFHDDDLMAPGFLEYAISALEQNENVVFVSSMMRQFEGHSPELTPLSSSPHPMLCTGYDLVKLFLTGFPLHFGSTLYRSDILLRGLPDTDKYAGAGDRPFLLDLLGEDKHCGVFSQPLIFYRIHPQQDSKVGELDATHIIELYRAYRKILSKQWDIQTTWLFYKTTGFELLDSYTRLSPETRGSVLLFICNCREAGVLFYPFLLFYPLARIHRWLLRVWRYCYSLFRARNHR